MMTSSDESSAQQRFLPDARRGSSASSATAHTLCSSVTFFPLHALQRVLQCFGYTHTVTMQSGRTYVCSCDRSRSS